MVIIAKGASPGWMSENFEGHIASVPHF